VALLPAEFQLRVGLVAPGGEAASRWALSHSHISSSYCILSLRPCQLPLNINQGLSNEKKTCKTAAYLSAYSVPIHRNLQRRRAVSPLQHCFLEFNINSYILILATWFSSWFVSDNVMCYCNCSHKKYAVQRAVCLIQLLSMRQSCYILIMTLLVLTECKNT